MSVSASMCVCVEYRTHKVGFAAWGELVRAEKNDKEKGGIVWWREESLPCSYGKSFLSSPLSSKCRIACTVFCVHTSSTSSSSPSWLCPVYRFTFSACVFRIAFRFHFHSITFNKIFQHFHLKWNHHHSAYGIPFMTAYSKTRQPRTRKTHISAHQLSPFTSCGKSNYSIFMWLLSKKRHIFLLHISSVLHFIRFFMKHEHRQMRTVPTESKEWDIQSSIIFTTTFFENFIIGICRFQVYIISSFRTMEPNNGQPMRYCCFDVEIFGYIRTQ